MEKPEDQHPRPILLTQRGSLVLGRLAEIARKVEKWAHCCGSCPDVSLEPRVLTGGPLEGAWPWGSELTAVRRWDREEPVAVMTLKAVSLPTAPRFSRRPCRRAVGSLSSAGTPPHAGLLGAG